MPPGFSGNLIFAIIARMLCGNHLNCPRSVPCPVITDNGADATYSILEIVLNTFRTFEVWCTF